MPTIVVFFRQHKLSLVFQSTQTFIMEPQIVQCPSSPNYESPLLFSPSDELGRVRLRFGSKKGSDYINASFIDVN